MNLDKRTDEEIIKLIRAAGQVHVLRWWDSIGKQGQSRLLSQLREIDVDLLRRLAEQVNAGTLCPTITGNASLPEYIRRPETCDEMIAWEAAIETGERLLRSGKVAALMVAGGQGTRLGFGGPKGAFPIGPVSGKTLFEIHAERVLATRRRYRCAMPWYIMTSDATDEPTKEYFESNNYLGLPPEDILFFKQRMMPAVDQQFKLVLTAKDNILMAPNGHGGTLLALAETGMLDDMERRGIEEISYFQVDNPLVPAADPVFLGFHSKAHADMSSKALWKCQPEEPIGAFVQVADRTIVKEYSELTPEQMRERTTEGKLLYGLGSIAIHAIRVDFVRKETKDGFRLPFHLANKISPYLDESGQQVLPEEKNTYKFETFIFDALKDAERTVILEIRREEEFAPVKNAEGNDSPATSRRQISRLYAAWLAEADISVARDSSSFPLHPVEISPLFALDSAELAARLASDVEVDGPLYLGVEALKT